MLNLGLKTSTFENVMGKIKTSSIHDLLCRKCAALSVGIPSENLQRLSKNCNFTHGVSCKML